MAKNAWLHDLMRFLRFDRLSTVVVEWHSGADPAMRPVGVADVLTAVGLTERCAVTEWRVGIAA